MRFLKSTNVNAWKIMFEPWSNFDYIFFSYCPNKTFVRVPKVSDSVGIPPTYDWVREYKKLQIDTRFLKVGGEARMCQCPAKGTSWHVCQSKTKISLHIHTVWSVFDGHSMFSQGSNVLLGGKLRLWSNWIESSLNAPYAGYWLEVFCCYC